MPTVFAGIWWRQYPYAHQAQGGYGGAWGIVHHALLCGESCASPSPYATFLTLERGFGRLKNEWAMLPLRVRRIAKVRLHVDLTILAQLATALAKARASAVPLAA